MFYRLILLVGLLFCQNLHAQDTASAYCCSYPVTATAINPNIKFGNETASSFGCRVRISSISKYTLVENYTLPGHTDDITSLCFSTDGFLLASSSKDKTVIVWDLILRKARFVFKRHTETVMQVKFSHDGKMVATCGKDGKVLLWNTNNGEIANELTNNGPSANSLSFSNNDKSLAIAFEDGTIKIWDMQLNKFTTSLHSSDEPLNYILFYTENKLIAAGRDKKIYAIDITSPAANFVLSGHTGPVTSLAAKVDSSQTLFFSASEDETIRKWDGGKSVLIATLKGHHDRVLSLAVSSNVSNGYANLLLSGSADKSLRFWNIGQGTYAAELVATGDETVILRTVEGYFYNSSKSQIGINYIHDKNDYLPAKYAELKYNRPDKVLAALQLNPDKQKQFEKGYSKRIRRSSIDSSLFASPDFPSVTLQKSLPAVADQKSIKLSLSANETRGFLNKVIIKVNGVGKTISLKKENLKSWSADETVSLSNGKNYFQIYSVNDLGAESEKISFSIYYNGEKIEENLYVFSIGCSRYKEDAYNLQFSSSDALNFSIAAASQPGFNHTYSYVMTDSTVTREIVKEIQNKLSKITVNDQVVVFYSGHGILGKNLDYYLGSYGTNFDHPEEGSIAYEELENMLANTPSRKKIVFIDACHSGKLKHQAA